jgi:hypothetical protein
MRGVPKFAHCLLFACNLSVFDALPSSQKKMKFILSEESDIRVYSIFQFSLTNPRELPTFLNKITP